MELKSKADLSLPFTELLHSNICSAKFSNDKVIAIAMDDAIQNQSGHHKYFRQPFLGLQIRVFTANFPLFTSFKKFAFFDKISLCLKQNCI